MKRPTKKEIKELVEGLRKDPTPDKDRKTANSPDGKPASKKTSMRIRKQGI